MALVARWDRADRPGPELAAQPVVRLAPEAKPRRAPVVASEPVAFTEVVASAVPAQAAAALRG